MLCHIILSNILNVYHSPAHLFHSPHLSLPALYQFQKMSQLQQSTVHLQFTLHVVIIIYTIANHWAFYFQASRASIYCCGIWPGSICMVHITLQELQVIALMLCKNGLSVACQHCCPTFGKQYCKSYVTKVAQPLLLSRLACCIFHLADFSYSSIQTYPSLNGR